jgi:hypothetical protein
MLNPHHFTQNFPYLDPMISPQKHSLNQTVGIRNATDFSPFGVELRGRNFEVSGGGNYRYGFNGMEADNEVKGDETNLD